MGRRTAGRKWITYQINEAWNKGMGVVGIRIHGLKDRDGYTSSFGVRRVTLRNLVVAGNMGPPDGYLGRDKVTPRQQGLDGSHHISSCAAEFCGLSIGEAGGKTHQSSRLAF